MSDRGKDAELLALRPQITLLERQLRRSCLAAPGNARPPDDHLRNYNL
jgi:hypothetical protein